MENETANGSPGVRPHALMEDTSIGGQGGEDEEHKTRLHMLPSKRNNVPLCEHLQHSRNVSIGNQEPGKTEG